MVRLFSSVLLTLILTYIRLQSLKTQSMSDYDVTLGARLHANGAPTTPQAAQSKEVNILAILFLYSDLTVLYITQEPNKCDGGCGLKALTSSPTENCSYYAQTAVRPQCMYVCNYIIQFQLQSLHASLTMFYKISHAGLC